MDNEQVRVAFIGASGRGTGLMGCLKTMADVRITAICDLYKDRAVAACEHIRKELGYAPLALTDHQEVLERDDVDCVVIASSWETHTALAIAAMKAGKTVGMEVGGAYSIQECWDLVKTSEETGIDCMMLENCCYGREEMAILRMIREGVFGEVVHCQGGYQHDLREEVAMGLENRHYRFNNYRSRNGEIYPTHEVGPIAKYLNINDGNRFVTLSSMSSKARGLHEWIVAHKGGDHEHARVEFTQGDVVTTMIKCAHGETVLLVHDTTLPRVYSRGGRVQGTKAIWMEDKGAVYIEGLSPPEDWDNLEASWEPLKKYLGKYEHPLWAEYLANGVRGGHGGMDYLVLRAFFESVKNGTRTPIDVYDTATWMAVTCLSEESVALGSMPVAFPDFTRGTWMRPRKRGASKYSLDLEE